MVIGSRLCSSLNSDLLIFRDGDLSVLKGTDISNSKLDHFCSKIRPRLIIF